MATIPEQDSHAHEASANRQDLNKFEESVDAYCIGGFHPVCLGDAYHDRYEVLSKLGYGRYSTVWLVLDQKVRGRQFPSGGLLTRSVPILTAKGCPVLPSMSLKRLWWPSIDDIYEPEIVLGGWGSASFMEQKNIKLIQPIALCSPEVLIRAPWDAKTDLWNLGAVIMEVFRAQSFFSGCVPPDENYELSQHMHKIVDKFGPFPKRLLEKGHQESVEEIFDDEGYVKQPRKMSKMPPLGSEIWIPGLGESVRVRFVSFLKEMMKVDPEKRKSPMDLLKHPWLDAWRLLR
ncbi:kinase-like domain-containing protein [Lophiotrema nucula]|uniref:non-specific serine/threonine protein kinase n=1 Tax=Lophiotrema nucula TaxID=690887 RepID=A0A6A5Z2D3_9PLEO|nr:kinase-like domain-containing protein [Lophiotrema nucula]